MSAMTDGMTDGTGAITVNVGGTVYTTTLATLTRVEGSMLGALAEALSDDEVLFIDRDGPSFRYVLNYLRDPFAKPLLPRDPTELDQLAREADFYGIPGLLSRLSTNGWKGESACTQVVTQAELDGIEGPRQFPCRDLRCCSLRFMDLTGWNLRGCNLAGVDATGANFAEADLRGCNLGGVDASGAYFSSAELDGANLAGVNASSAIFENINLSGVNLSGANLQEAKFSIFGLYETNNDFTGANVRRAMFHGTNQLREQVEREAARGDFFGPPFEPAPDDDPFERNSGISRSVGAVFGLA